MNLGEVRVLISSDCRAHFQDTRKRWQVHGLLFLEKDISGQPSPKTEWLTINLIPCVSKKKIPKHHVSRRITLYSEEIIVAFGTTVSSRVPATDQKGRKQELFFLKDDTGSVREIRVTYKCK